jgi:hypothetical protein
MTRLLCIAISPLLFSPVLADGLAGGEAGGKAAVPVLIAPLVDGQTVAVLHLRVDKLDAGQLVRLAGKVFELKPADTAMAEAAAKLALVALGNAGVKDVYAVSSLDGFPVEPGFVAIPVAGDEESKQVAAAVKLVFNLKEASDKAPTSEMLVHHFRGFVLIAPKSTAKRLTTLQSILPPHLTRALESFPTADVRLAVVLPNALRRSLGELMPDLPREVGGGKTARMLNGFQYVAAGITLAPKFSADAVLHTADADAAAATRVMFVELLKLGKTTIATNGLDPKSLPQLETAIGLLTPKQAGDRLSWQVSDDALVQVVRPLITQMQGNASQAQSANNLKQLGLAMWNYHQVHKHFPTGIRDKQGKLMLSWRVQILPYVEGDRLYKQFKLDEPWDSVHNLPLAMRMPDVFRSPGSKAAPGKTSYLGPTGKGLFFDRSVAERKFHDITDGSSNTIMLLNVDDDHAVTWTKPEDIDIDSKESLRGLGGNPTGRFQAVFGDGSIHTISRKIGADFYKLLTIDGGELPPALR